MTKFSPACRAIVLVALSLSTGTAGVSAGIAGVSPASRAPQAIHGSAAFAATRHLQTPATPASNRVQTIQFESKLIGKTLPYNVLLPVDYNQPAAKTKRYPVVYLLHGLTGHYTNWLEYTRLTDYTAGYEFIIVMPEGNNSWYTDSATVPTDKYESYIVQELIPDVEKRFRASSAREGRAIAGLSMGGYGALKFGVKYPQLFVFAASMSGALDAASWTKAQLGGFEFILQTLLPVYGAENSETRAANDISKLYRELPAERIAALPFVYLDCGSEDPLLATNRSFVDILLSRKIPHEYRQLPGGHAWPYWDAQVQEVLRVAAKRLRQPATSASAAVNQVSSESYRLERGLVPARARHRCRV
jgi:S-formylglutathione hydrolase FrmB